MSSTTLPAPSRSLTQARSLLIRRTQPATPLYIGYIGTTEWLPTTPMLYREPDDAKHDWVLSALEHDVLYQHGTLGMPAPVLANLQRPAFRDQQWELVIAHEIEKVPGALQPTGDELARRVLAMPNASTASAAWLDHSVRATQAAARWSVKGLALAAGAALAATAQLAAADPVLLGALPFDGGWAVYILAVW